jgi:hypothetical protein
MQAARSGSSATFDGTKPPEAHTYNFPVNNVWHFISDAYTNQDVHFLVAPWGASDPMPFEQVRDVSCENPGHDLDSIVFEWADDDSRCVRHGCCKDQGSYVTLKVKTILDVPLHN